MNRYKCVVSYDGYDYVGYQKQNHNPNTIQETIQKAFFNLFKKEIIIYGSGRTDAKVHALGQTFHVDLDVNITTIGLKNGLNSFLPESIRILKVSKIKKDFHARYDVKRKVYEYRIINKKEISPFESRYYAKVEEKLNLERLKQAALLFVGKHDFRNFTTNKVEEVETFEKTIYQINVKKKRNYIYIEYIGSGFLRYMVRMITGALIVVATEKKDINYIEDLLFLNSKEKCSYKAKPQGLYLKKVDYK